MPELAKRKKPKKPHRSFPLTAHNNGQWCKKIRGKVHFFGVWADPQAALDNYLRVAADLHAGRKPRESTLAGPGVTVKGVANHYLTYQAQRVEEGEITPRWLDDCLRTVEHFVKSMGTARLALDVRSEDFHQYRQELVRRGLTGRRGLDVHALDRSITVVKAMFEHAYQTDLLERPVKYGDAFRRSSADSKRKSKARMEIANGKRLFEPLAIRSMLAGAGVPLRAMILMGINGAFGSTDCARLPISAVNLDKAVVEFPRPKTGIERVVPLWPETVEAIREAMTKRPEPANDEAAALVFLTVKGRSWVRQSVRPDRNGLPDRVTRVDAAGEEFDKIIIRLGLKRRGIGFYTLRHTFRTWADEVRDQHAIHRIMGHAIPGMSGIYVERIELHRLRAVVDHVRRKLFGEPAPSSSEGPTASPAT